MVVIKGIVQKITFQIQRLGPYELITCFIIYKVVKYRKILMKYNAYFIFSLFSSSTQLSIIFILLINAKLPTVLAG